MDRPLLLDTHAWIWMMEGREGVRPEAVELMERAAAESLLRVSIISAREVGMFEAKGRLRFSVPCERWIELALGVPGLSLVPLTPAICVRSYRLPGDFHGDPADRLLVATARETWALLLSRDERILACGRSGHPRVQPV
jgi:PIN domain nuclease of toxin-antitoxin system